jgi:hypothetical protein
VQHTPSTQLLDSHSLAVLQIAPAVSFPTHVPAAQYWLLLQSPSAVQVFGPPLQSLSTQVDPVGQVSLARGGQLPAPSQNATSVATPFAQSGA